MGAYNGLNTTIIKMNINPPFSYYFMCKQNMVLQSCMYVQEAGAVRSELMRVQTLLQKHEEGSVQSQDSEKIVV